ncbi:neutral amino acid [Lentinula edodes]|uniref:Neutral amino acid n=1 Tax=Lentinula edodes TaxID=5353 RepID=A0A1Q3EQI3_LENED|nr:neutral amino acid [Lentinula edodes]
MNYVDQDISAEIIKKGSPRDELSVIHGEEGHQIKYHTCSWQKTAALLFSEYICLAILSFPWSFSVLGMVPGVIVTCAVAASVQYTSLVLWKFCMKHPEARDVCDVGKIILGGSQIAYHFTAVMFLLNNVFIMVSQTTYIAGMSAFLNISYTLIGQITIPSPLFKKIAFSFAIPTIVYLGALYASVSARFVFFRVFSQSHHRHSNTAVAWMAWAGILIVLWVAAFIIAEIIPFFSDLLSLMSSLFDSWFGFIYWGLAYLILYPCNKRWNGFGRSVETLLNYFLVLFGLYILIAGTYVSVKTIIDSYHASLYGGVFSCVPNGI